VNRLGLFVHEPSDERSVLPTTCCPNTLGGVVFIGSGGNAGAGATSGDGALADDPMPSVFDAVTTARSVLPTSAETRAYCEEAAPEIEAQLAPAESQRRHW